MPQIDEYSRASFELAYLNAIKQNKEVFTFQGQDVLVEYAKYWLEAADAAD